MPPVELDIIPCIPSHSVHNIKDSVDFCNDGLDLGTFEPILTRSSGSIPEDTGTIEDVKIPEASNLVINDEPVHATDDSFGEMAAIASNFTDTVASYALVRTGLKTLDLGLDISEKVLSTVSTRSAKQVQSMRRHLRAVRHAGRRHAREGIESLSSKRRALRRLPSRKSQELRESSLFGYFIEMFQINWFLSFFGITLTFVADPVVKIERKNDFDDQDCSDEETTVYKLMKDYESHDDVDYIPSDSSVDSMEFYLDLSEDETTVDKLMKNYSDIEDCDYIPSDACYDSLEYNSDEDAEVSDDSDSSDSDFSDSDDLSEDETTVGMILKDYSEESADDVDYVPCEETEGDLEFNSNASVSMDTASELSEDDEDPEEESQEDELCSTLACEKSEHNTVDEISQDSQEVEDN